MKQEGDNTVECVCVLDGVKSASKWHTVTVTLRGIVLGEARDRRIHTV